MYMKDSNGRYSGTRKRKNLETPTDCRFKFRCIFPENYYGVTVNVQFLCRTAEIRWRSSDNVNNSGGKFDIPVDILSVIWRVFHQAMSAERLPVWHQNSKQRENMSTGWQLEVDMSTLEDYEASRPRLTARTTHHAALNHYIQIMQIPINAPLSSDRPLSRTIVNPDFTIP